MTVIIKYLGHAAIYIESGEFKALIDPFLRGNPQTQKRPSDFANVSHIFVTHGHGDHLGDTVEIAKLTGAKVIANYEIVNYLMRQGVVNVHAMHIGGRVKLGFGIVKMTPAVHGSSIMENDELIYAGNPGGFVTTVDGLKIYHAGDTGLTMDLQLLKDEDLDVAILPIGGNFTMDVDDAAKAVKMIEPRKVIPIHYNTFDVIKASPERFAELVTQAEVIIMKPDEVYTL